MARTRAAAVPIFRVHMLDMGAAKFGDCLLIEAGRTTILIDGAHPGDDRPEGGGSGLGPVPRQLVELLGSNPPFDLDLLVVTHAHVDHIGCLPAMVGSGLLRAKHALVADPDLGWGRIREAPAADSEALATAGTAALDIVSALREESRAEVASDAEVAKFLADAVNLEPAYRSMLDILANSGTKVVRFGRDPDSAVRAIEKKFAKVGLKVLGPTRAHLATCARRIGQSARALTKRASADAAPDPVALYRRIARESAPPPADALGLDPDSAASPGPAINDQSLVLRLEFSGAKVLLTGDMQLARPEVPGLKEEMLALRAAISAEAPFHFIKLGHHGSDNALNEAVLTDWKGSPLLGISTGSGDPAHPNPRVLTLLNELADLLTWVRTDRNGRVSLEWDPAADEFKTVQVQAGKSSPGLARGEVNDPRPNMAADDAPKWSAPPPAPAPNPKDVAPAIESPIPLAPPPGELTTRRAEDGSIELVARLPRGANRVTLSFDLLGEVEATATPPAPLSAVPGLSIGPDPGGPDGPAPPIVPAVGSPGVPYPIAPGRPGLRLLFVTDRLRLAGKITAAQADAILGSIAAPHQLLELPVSASYDPAAAAAVVAQAVRLMASPPDGVVLLGGYDVVASQRVDVLEPADRPTVEYIPFDTEDGLELDDFRVWSDAVYGDYDGDGLTDLPVSRIPDGGDAALMVTALSAPPPVRQGGRVGIRNVYRPFAEVVFNTDPPPRNSGVPGNGPMWHSEPHVHTATPGPVVASDHASDHVYLMLHGSHDDPLAFLGEADIPPNRPVAFHISNVPKKFSGVVFSGCCWGGLTVAERARDLAPDTQPRARTPGNCIPLAFLKAGAVAYVGCTGAHYSPTRDSAHAVPGSREIYFTGEPIHRRFWKHYRDGAAPALALQKAKEDYILKMPAYTKEELVFKAIARKTLRMFTCLGLGW